MRWSEGVVASAGLCWHTYRYSQSEITSIPEKDPAVSVNKGLYTNSSRRVLSPLKVSE